MQSMFGHMAAWQQAIADAAGFAGGAAALVGFSLGGHLVLRLRGSVPAVVAFFAPLLTGLGASPAAGTRVEIHHGESDRLVDIRQADRIASQLISEGTPVEVHRYANAGHGFSGAHPGDAEALNRSRSLTIAFATAPSSYELHTTAGDGC
jgi:dienelactone hydrolase